MKKTLSIILLLGICINVSSQSFLKEFSYNGTEAYQVDNSRAICVLPSGNIILVGEVVRGSSYWNGYGYGYFIKLNSQGNILQTKEISESIAGSITTLNMVESNKITMTSSMGAYSSITIFDTSLNILSDKRYYGGGEFYYCRLTQTEKTLDNNYISVGTSGGLSNGQASVWVLKTSSTGAVLWGKGYGLGGDEDGADIIEINGSYYAYGYGTGYLGYTVPWLLKLDENGNLIWAKIIKAPIGGGNCRTIVKTTENNLLLTYEASHNSSSLNRAKSDICISVLDTNGVNIWSKKYLSSTFNKNGETKIDENGNIYFTGFLDKDTSYRFVGDIDRAMPYVTKLDNNGNVIWARGVLDTTNYISPLLESPLSNNFDIYGDGVYFAFTAALKGEYTTGGYERFKTILSKTIDGQGCVYNVPTQFISFTPSIIDITSSVDILSGSTEKVKTLTENQIMFNAQEVCNLETDISQIDKESKIKIYPNPIYRGDELTVSGEKINKIEVYGINGALVRSFKINELKEVETYSLREGIYYLSIYSENKTTRKKIIVIE